METGEKRKFKWKVDEWEFLFAIDVSLIVSAIRFNV